MHLLRRDSYNCWTVCAKQQISIQKTEQTKDNYWFNKIEKIVQERKHYQSLLGPALNSIHMIMSIQTINS